MLACKSSLNQSASLQLGKAMQPLQAVHNGYHSTHNFTVDTKSSSELTFIDLSDTEGSLQGRWADDYYNCVQQSSCYGCKYGEVYCNFALLAKQ